MIIDSINKTENKLFFSQKNKKDKKYKNSIKSLFIISTILIAGTFTVFVKDSYNQSKKLDSYEAYYNKLKPYDDFKAAMDAVPYTDEMFQKDLLTFKKIYGNKETRSAVGYNDYNFVYARIMLNNDTKKVDKYISYFKGYDETSFYKDKIELKQYDYVKSLYKNDKNMKLNSITVNKTISSGLTSETIIENRQRYLKENNIYKYTYGLSREDWHKYLHLSKENQKKFDENQTKGFYNFVDTASEDDLRKMFKAINSYQFLVAQNHFGLRKSIDMAKEDGYISKFYYDNIPMFGLIELMRNKNIYNDDEFGDRYRAMY